MLRPEPSSPSLCEFDRVSVPCFQHGRCMVPVLVSGLVCPSRFEVVDQLDRQLGANATEA